VKFDVKGLGVYRLIIGPEGGRVEQGDGEAAVTISMDMEEAIKLFTGKSNPVAAVMTGKIKISGEIKALMLLQQLL
jgi:putative sterol carrier protein